ncbi:MAG TPA: class I SAM-dependent methyltransferase [Desulfuromonadaceae bacterium]
MSELYGVKSVEYYSGVRHSLIDLIPAGPNKVLELGCARGYTLLAAREAGKAAEIVGIDILPREQSHDLLDHYLRNESDNIAIDYPPGYFDVILCADVLEHFVDPWRAVRQLHHYLKPGGVLIASIPNIRFYKVILRILLGGDFRYDAEGGILDRTHLRFFCKRNMGELFTGAGFRVTAFHGKISLLYRVLTLLSLGLSEGLWVRQYTIVARKPETGPEAHGIRG